MHRTLSVIQTNADGRNPAMCSWRWVSEFWVWLYGHWGLDLDRISSFCDSLVKGFLVLQSFTSGKTRELCVESHTAAQNYFAEQCK
jgi:hypothetical protein